MITATGSRRYGCQGKQQWKEGTWIKVNTGTGVDAAIVLEGIAERTPGWRSIPAGTPNQIQRLEQYELNDQTG
jgi:hypothetical protein